MSTALKHDAGTAPTSRVRRALGGTPRRLILLTAGLVVLGLLLGLVYALGLGRDASGFTDLDARTTEVSATSDLYYELNDMDAQAANALLVGYHPADPTLVPAAVDAAASDAVYEQDRAAADADLEQIADNPLLTAQVRKLLDGLGSYEALIAQALYVDEAAQHEQPAAPRRPHWPPTPRPRPCCTRACCRSPCRSPIPTAPPWTVRTPASTPP